MPASKKTIELDARVQKIIDEEFSDYEKYLATPQDVKQYQRKRASYWEKIIARVKEELNDGRADDNAAVAGSN